MQDDKVISEEYINAIGEIPFLLFIMHNPTTQYKGVGQSDIADVAKDPTSGILIIERSRTIYSCLWSSNIS